MNVNPQRIAEARAIAAELDIPADTLDDSGLGEMIASARNTAHLRTILRQEAIDAGFLDGITSNGELTAEQVAAVAHDADDEQDQDDATDTDDEDEADDEADEDAPADDPHAYTDFAALLAQAIAKAGADKTFKALTRLAGRPARTARAARQPRGEAALRYSNGVDPALLPAGTVRARLHKDGDTSAVLAVVKLDQAGADRARFTPATADEADFGWGVMCLAHGTTTLRRTRRDARQLTMTPAKFCAGCAAGH